MTFSSYHIKIICFLSIALFQVISAFGKLQKSNTDSDTSVVIELNEKALHMAYSQPDSAMIIALKSLKIARELKFPHGEIRALIRIGIVYDVLSKDSMATESYMESLLLAKKTKDTAGIASNLNNLGLIHWKQNQLHKALNYFNQAYEMFRKKQQYINKASAANNIGLIYDEMERPKTALFWYYRALQNYKKAPNKSAEPFVYDVYANIGSAYQIEKNIDSVQFYTGKAIEGFRKTGNLYGLAKALNNYGISLNENNEPDKAIPYFKEAMTIAFKMENMFSYASSCFNISSSYARIKEFDKEMEVLKKAYPFVTELRSNELGYKICFYLARAHFRQNNFEEGNKFLEEYYDLHSAYYNEIINKNITESEKKFEVQESKRKLAEAQNEKLKAELDLKEKNYWLLILSISIVAGIFVTIIITQKNKARQEKEKNQAILQERDKGLKAIIEAQEEERKRIAGELHEGVGNQLLALKMNLSTDIANDQKESIVVNKLLTDIIDEVRAVSHQMMPKVLQEFGCVPALNDMLENTFTHSGIKYHFETHKVSNKRYDPRIETAIYRVTQEAVSNIIKHAKATTVAVQLIEARNTLVLLIEDNGKGIEATQDNKGLGITNIKSRISAVNGEVNISSKKNSGTTITARIPLA